jgi:putative ABC transport system ATP-binding protein
MARVQVHVGALPVVHVTPAALRAPKFAPDGAKCASIIQRMSAEPPILSGRGLTRFYRIGAVQVAALRQVDCDIAPGDFVAVEGPSGSGKTTLINLLGLLDRPDSGALRLDGVDVAPLGETARADLRRDRIGFVFQAFNLVPVLSAVENVAWPMTIQGVPAREARRRSLELLERVGLRQRAEQRPDLLSGGERQRVAIARALANRPRVVLADEPTANLDSRTADAMLDLIAELNVAEKVAFLVATHDHRVTERALRRRTLRDGAFVDAA